jgi:hypothetical protein
MQLRSLLERLDKIETLNLYEGLNKSDSQSMMLWESAGKAIKEAALTADQIQQIFTSVEQGASAAGGNRTMVGQGKDAASAVKKAYDDLVSKVQNSGPMKSADAMYDQAAEKLKAATGGDAGVMQYVQKYRDFAKAHPVAQSLIYSALIAAAGISGVGIGGAAALGLFKMVDKLLQGEKFSTSLGKGLATGATAFAAGQIGQAFKGTPPPGGNTSGIPDSSTSYAPPTNADGSLMTGQQIAASQGALKTGNAAGNAMNNNFNAAFNHAEQTQNISDLAGKGFARAGDVLRDPKAVAALKVALAQDPVGGAAQAVLQQIAPNLSANAVNAVLGSAQLHESVNLSTRQIATLFSTVLGIALQEGMWDSIKGLAGKAAGAVANKATTVGHNLTTKVTADKLQSAWKKAGSPLDSEAVADVLQKAGVDPAVISKAYTDLKIPAPAGKVEPTSDNPAAGGVNIKDMLAQIMKLDPKDQQQVLAYLKK